MLLPFLECLQAFLSLMSEKLKAEDNILPGIKKSGKEELYAELMHFLSFGPRRYFVFFSL